MAKKMNIDVESLKDINKFVKTYAREYCNLAADMITDAAKVAIEQFYKSYKPIPLSEGGYDRTWDLRRNSAQRYFHDNGRAFIGGVRICTDKMSPYKGKNVWSPETVVEATWTKGYHGRFGNDSNRGIYTFPPLSSLQQFVGNKKNFEKINEQALTFAKKQRYKVQKFI